MSMKFFNEKSRTKSHSMPEKEHYSAIALAVLGLSQLGCGQWREAELWLNQALALDSTLPEAHLGLAEIECGRMRYDLAIAHSQKATASKHFKGEAYRLQAQCLEEMNWHDQASQAMREAYKWSDQLPEYHRKNIQNWSEIFSSFEGRDLYEIPDDFRSTVIPFMNYEGYALLPVIADGQDLDSVLLDTGFGGSLMISPKHAEKLGLVYSGEIITRTFYGKLVIKVALVKSIRLADLVVNNVPAYVCDDVPGGFDGLIGWQLLKHFNFSIASQVPGSPYSIGNIPTFRKTCSVRIGIWIVYHSCIALTSESLPVSEIKGLSPLFSIPVQLIHRCTWILPMILVLSGQSHEHPFGLEI